MLVIVNRTERGGDVGAVLGFQLPLRNCIFETDTFHTILYLLLIQK